MDSSWIQIQSVYNGPFTVTPRAYSHIPAVHREGQKVAFTFECIEGGNRIVDFVLCDEGSFSLWQSTFDSWEMSGSFNGFLQGIDMIGAVRILQSTSGEGEFIIPFTGTWVYVFSNVFSVQSKTVQLGIDVYQLLSPIIIGAGIGLLLVGLLVVISFFILRRRRNKYTEVFL
jgi:hypothetical protein